MSQPDFTKPVYIKHGRLLCSSYTHWTGKPLIADQDDPEKLIHALFAAPFAIVSHGTEDDPVFNFGNKTALSLFELEWDQFIQTPSRESVEITNKKERDKLMTRVSTEGYIDDYSGVRVSSSGKRFLIKNATIWNVVDEHDNYYGQAAMFKDRDYV